MVRVHQVGKREVLRVVVGLLVRRGARKGEGKLPAVVEVHNKNLLHRTAAALHLRNADARVDVQRVRQVLTQSSIFDRKRDQANL